MKRIIMLVLLPLVAGYTLSFAQQKQYLKTTVTLLFHSKPPTDTVTIRTGDNQNFISPYSEQLTAIVNNRVQADFELDHPIFIMADLKGGNLFFLRGYTTMFGFFLEPGDHVTYDIGPELEKGLLNITFSGKGSEKFNFLKENAIQLHQKISRSRFGMPIDSAFIQSRQQTLLTKELLNKYKRVLSPVMYAQCKETLIAGFYASSLFDAAVSSEESSLKKYFKEYIVPIIPEFQDSKKQYNDSVLGFLTLVAKIGYYGDRNLPYDINGFENQPEKLLSVIEKRFKSSRLRDELITYNIARQSLKKGLPPGYITYLKGNFIKNNRNKDLVSQVDTMIHQYATRLTKGQPAFEFALQDTTGKVIKQSDFKGKVVVLDYFFNGCAGCYTTAPVLDSLEQVYKGKNIQFIAISVDRDKQLWKQGIGRYSAKKALQLYTNGEGQSHGLIRYYNIGSYPTITIIDKGGKIINAKAPDPRTPEGLKRFTSIIDTALQK